MNLRDFTRFVAVSTVFTLVGTLAFAQPEPPAGLSAVAISGDRINLTWSDLSSNEDGFQVFRADSMNGPWFEAVTTEANTTSSAITGLSASTSYYFAVRSFNADGPSRFSNVDSATTLDGSAPSPPAAVSARGVSADEIDLSWSDTSDNEAGFEIFRSATSLGPWNRVGVTAPNATSYISTGLEGTTTYYFAIRGFNSVGSSAFSSVVHASTTGANRVPAAPTDLVAIAVWSSQINIFWEDAAEDETGFRIERAPAAGGPWSLLAVVGANAAGYADTSLQAVTIYYYRVQAFNDAGDSEYSNISGATTFGAAIPNAPPTELSATVSSASQIDLRWTDNSTNESGFRIERYTSAGWTEIAQISGSSYSDSGLNAATTYYYRVRAYNSAGNSAYSNIVTATTRVLPPAAPSGLTAHAASPTEIDLVWTDNSSNEVRFSIERAGSAAGPFVQIGSTTATSYADSGLQASTTYYYRVRASNAGGSSAPASANATTPAAATAPAPPTSLTAVASSSSQIQIAWTDASDDERGFRIERSLSAAGPFSQIVTTGSNTTGYVDTGLSAATTYYYRVLAFNDAGPSGYSPTASATTKPSLPAPPSALIASAASSTQINLSWTDGSSNEAGFKIERAGSPSGPFTQIATRPANATSYVDTGLAASTSYSYRVRAYNSAGDSSPSNTASATTLSVVTLPDPPLALSAHAVSSSEIDISWTDGSSNETGFKIERAASPSGPFTQIATRSANTTSYADTGLGASTPYSYRVRAYNSAGDSAYSNIATAATSQGSTDTIPPSVPQDVTILAPGCGKIALSWSPSSDTGGSGLKGYNIYRSGTFVKQVPASATSAEDSGLPPANYVSYTLSAVDVAGNQSARTPSVGIPTQACTGSGGGDHIWSKSFGSFQLPDNGFAIVSDRSGNIFVVGEFQMAVDFGSGAISSDGGRDIFVAKYAPDGRPLWSRQFGGIYDDSGKALAVDPQGNLFVTGPFQQSIDFGGHVLTSAGGYDIFLAKLSGADGRPQWSKRFGGVGDDRAEGLAVDSRGDAVITGQFKGTVDFGDGPVTNTSSYAQAFLAKYSGVDGGHLWSQRFGQLYSSTSSTFGSGQAVAMGPDDAPVITGYFKGNVDFGTGPLDNAGGLDIFLAKFTASGAPLWARGFGDVSDDHGLAVTVDPSANVAITGDFLGAVDFGAGPLASTSNAETIFLASFAPAGTSRWSRSFIASGVNAGSHGYSVATDSSGSIVLSGSISGPVDLGGGRMPVIGTVFLAKYSSAGTSLWAKLFNGHGGRGKGLDIDPAGKIVIAGTFEGDIDLGGGSYSTEGGVSTDLFIGKFGP